MKAGCVGNTASNSSKFNFNLCLQDSPTGVRFAQNASAFSASINVAATFDRDIFLQHGVAMGEEFRGKGINVALGPMMNIGRVAAGGRNWEGQGGDPYLAAESARLQVRGLQSQGVMATAKHFIGNEQEHFRTGSSSQIDDRTLHEIYVKPFKACVDEGVTAIMCSYNLLNQTYACENDHAINTILKGQLGFRGFVMTDWWATGATVASANGGSDLMMPGENAFGSPELTWGNNLQNAISSGQVKEARVTDMVTRMVAAWYKVGQDKGYPALNMDSWNPANGKVVNVQGNHAKHIRAVGAASSVLLKNSGNVLPLKNGIKIAVVGSDAGPGHSTDNSCADHGCHSGTIAQGWGSGTANFPYIVTPLEGITARAQKAKSKVVSSLSDDLSAASAAAQNADVVVVFVNSNSGEDYITVEGNEGDRNNLTLWNNGNALIEQAAKTNKKVVVVIHAPGQVEMPWIKNPNVVAVVHALFPGQESGNSIADVLFGDVNPSARLPFTINEKASDYGTSVLMDGTVPPGFKVPQVEYKEGLLVDYRWNDQKNIAPLFEFGFGLSYTSFDYSHFVKSAPFMRAGSAPISVTFTVRNVGKYDGHEVAQLYLGFPATAGEPPKQLKDFSRQFIAKGSSKSVTLRVPLSEMQIWNVAAQKWEVPRGTYTLMVGSSSRNIKWKGTYEYVPY
ncbi:hypothetical protein HDU91_007475 [Kappamyces sp. JEL0680]|nr:hypothetical protein HDU91_007475 [Kappamyces sp. JEL0680]